MRQRLRNFLPIVLIALTVQIIAPIAACWAASIAVSDPLRVAAICHDGGPSSSGQGDQTRQSQAHDGCCSMCSVAYIAASLDPQQAVVTGPYRDPERVTWLDYSPDLFGSRAGPHAQARAPPLLT